MADASPSRLARQLQFVQELDKLKNILRQTTLTDGSRRENAAEHSWHLATMTLLLAEYAPQPLDLAHALALALLHDIVEIDAGDSFCYDADAMRTKNMREAQAAARLFSLLPSDQTSMVHALWREFEEGVTNEARFVAALDRLQPLLQNYAAGGGSWKSHGITLAQVIERCAPIGDACPALWAYVQALIQEAARRGIIT